MPTLKDKIVRSTSTSWGTNTINEPINVEYVEIGQYKIAAVLSDVSWWADSSNFTTEYRGGISENREIKLYVQMKESEKIVEVKGPKLEIIDAVSSDRDRPGLYRYNRVSLHKVGDNQVICAFNKAGSKDSTGYTKVNLANLFN